MAGPDVWWKGALDEIETALKLRPIGKRQQCYFHLGQGIEFALKAIYMRRNGHQSWPSKHNGAAWHSLPHIASKARLDPEIKGLKGRRVRHGNWLTVKDWDSNKRFPDGMPSVREVNDLSLAVCDEDDGILVWLESVY